MFTIAVNPEYLANLLTAIAAMLGDDTRRVTLAFWTPDAPMAVVAKDATTGLCLDGMLMPLTTDPGVTMLFSRRRIHSRTVSLNHRNEKARSRQMMASAVRWPSKTSSRNSIGTYRPPNNRCCPVMKPLSGLK